jgi:hypothetical protein
VDVEPEAREPQRRELRLELPKRGEHLCELVLVVRSTTDKKEVLPASHSKSL